MPRAILYSLLTLTVATACSRAAGEKEHESLTEVKSQGRKASVVIPIPDGARDPIIDRYIQFTFGRGVNEPNELGNTPLIEAIRNRDEQSMVVLLEHPGVDLNVRDEYGYTPLHTVVFLGQEAIVERLLEKGANANTKSKSGTPALHHASTRENDAIVKMLLDHGAYVNSRNDVGWTALHQAASHKREANVALLLSRGADVNAKTKYGHTTLSFAAMRENDVIVEMLLDNGSEVNAKDPYEQAALKKMRGTCAR